MIHLESNDYSNGFVSFRGGSVSAARFRFKADIRGAGSPLDGELAFVAPHGLVATYGVSADSALEFVS
jgi:hypothetical protein